MSTQTLVQKPLRLMIYDDSDTKISLKRIREGISGAAGKALDLVVPDNVDIREFDVPVGLTHTWLAGGWLYRALGRIDRAQGFYSWEDALGWLVLTDPGRPIAEIEIWNHGSPGRSWMLQDRVLDASSPTSKQYGDLMALLRTRLAPNARIWFRSCSVFAGLSGHNFARAWTDFFGCRIAAHTHIINFWQAGLHTARPGVPPHWPLDEGGVGGRDVSVWSSPNRISCLQNSFPDSW